MTKKTLSLKLLFIMGISLAFVGCTYIKNDKTLLNSVESEKGSSIEDKNAEFSLTGILTSAGGTFFITDSSGLAHDIESYSVELRDYLGKTISVTGQYSGDTLFISSIE